MKNLATYSLLILLCSTLLAAQPFDRQPPEPNYDQLIALFGEGNIDMDCLKANREAFQGNVSQHQEQLRDLQQQMREAIRNGGDTAAIHSQIESVRSLIADIRANHVAQAQACVSGPALANLVAAEKLMNEVRQAIGLMLIQPTETGPRDGFELGMGRGPRGPRRGPPPTED